MTTQRQLRVAFGVSVAALVLVMWEYAGENVLANLVGGFAGSLGAFVLALTWEREREQRNLAKAANEARDRRATEVRRRFRPVLDELEKNLESLDFLVEALPVPSEDDPTEAVFFAAFHPQLLEGAWQTNTSALTEPVADYDLVSQLATTHGRIEEVRWRIRYRTEQTSRHLDVMTGLLAAELRDEIAALIPRVRSQIEAPDVQPLGLVHNIAGAVATATATGGSAKDRGAD